MVTRVYESLREFGGLQELSEFRGFSMGYESFENLEDYDG